MKWSRELRIARRSLRTALRAATARPLAVTPQTSGELTEIADSGSNPGRLAMFVYLPRRPVAPGAALIVLLHGCGQSAASFARTSGWLALSDRLGVPLVLPEQMSENNRGRCFNWFRPAHTGRGQGEALSIAEMVRTARDRFASDPARVFIAGLSAGGAMTAALLAAYPDVFAAGAVVAGLPVGAASTVTEALARMAEAGPVRSRQAWAQRVLDAAPAYAGPRPRVSIWHGLADDVVDAGNARLLAEQWSAVHGLESSTASLQPDGTRVIAWGPADGTKVELRMLPDLPHRWPTEAIDHVTRFWGLEAD